jgi:ceramide glucosyltransferase
VNLEGNLESSFAQDYENYEIIFSVASASDPAFALVQKLAKKYPIVKCSLVVGKNWDIS